ncbi:MAG TPA: GYD domain-containing protein [Pseudolabrys sp.]|nr:GYD domain-containing protein [Pseudolabrys sp.]
MLFCIMGQYTAQAVGANLDDTAADRGAAVEKLMTAAGAKLVAMYNYIAEGPSTMVIFDAPDQTVAAAITAVAVAGGGMQNVKHLRLVTQQEVAVVRQKAREIRSAYKAPGK